MSLYTKARRHIDMNRVKELREKKIAKQIAMQEQQYLLHFTQNVVPKHYDWRTGKFNENSLSLMQVNDIVLKRLEEIDDALSEGMTTKDFEYLYGGVVVNDIVSINPELVSSTFAQDLISASGEVTSHMFGPDFPGSHINSIGDFDKPDSTSKVDAQAHLARASDAKAAANPHDETHVFGYQSTDFTLPTAEQMAATVNNVASNNFFNDTMKQIIWPTYGQQSPLQGTDIVQGNSGPQTGQLSSYSYPWNDHVYPDDAHFESQGYDMSNLTAAQQEIVTRTRLSFVGGKYGGASGTYHDDNHFFDITYGTSRSINETSFDMVAGAVYDWDTDYPNLNHLDLGPGWAWEYDSSPGDDHSLTKEPWQYQENSEDFVMSHLEDIIGVTFPAVVTEKFNDPDTGIEKYFLQPGGTEDSLEPNQLPGLNDVNYASFYHEVSVVKKVIQNAHAGDVISFDYRIATEQWDNTEGVQQDGTGDGPYNSQTGDPNELYVVAGTRIMKAWSLYKELPDEETTEEYGFVLRNTESPVDTGTFKYTIQQDDINPTTGALDFVTAYHADDIYFSRASITNFSIGDGEKSAAGQLGRTTAAYNLGAPVAALTPNKGKGKKKKDEEEEEEIFGSESKELSDDDKELQAKEKQRLEDVAAAEAAEEKKLEEINKKIEKTTIDLDGAITWEGKNASPWDPSAGEFSDMTIDPNNPSQIPGMEGLKWINSIEELINAGTRADTGSSFYSSHLISMINGAFYNLDDKQLDKVIRSPAIRADFLAKTSPSFRKWILSVPTSRDYSKSGWTLTSRSSGDFFPPYKAQGLNVDALDYIFKGMDAGLRTGWWLPDDLSYEAYEEIKEAVRRSYAFFGWSRDYDQPTTSSRGMRLGSIGMRLGSNPEDDWYTNQKNREQDINKDNDMTISMELLDKAQKNPLSLTDEEIETLKKYGYKEEVAQIKDLRKLVQEDDGVDWNSVIETLLNAGNFALDVAALAGILFPEPGTSAAGMARLLPRLGKLLKVLRNIKAWWNKGRNTRIPNENQASIRQLGADDLAQRQRISADPNSPTNPFRGMPGYGTAKSKVNPRIRRINQKRKSQGKPPLSMDVVNPGGFQTGPTPSVRQAFERPVRAVRNAPALGTVVRSTARGATDIGESVEYKEKNISSSIDNTIDIFIKILYKMPADEARNIIEQIIEYAKNNNINRNEYSTFKRQNDIKQREVKGRTDRLNQFINDRKRQLQEPLYPGQPSPNGFPDTPPPKMAPNGYHPAYGKQSSRYRRLDPVSAVVMNKVKTDDPETNKEVAAAAKKPKVKLVPNTRSKKDKVAEAVWPKGLWGRAKMHW